MTVANALQTHENLWWLLFIRGLALVLLGIAAILWPGTTLAFLFLVFVVYLMVDGIIEIITSLASLRAVRYWWLKLVKGTLQIIIGAALLRSPALGLFISVITLVIILGLSFVVRGIIEITLAFKDEYDPSSKWLLLIVGVLGLLAGLIMLLNPVIGTLALAFILGLYALIAGAATMSASLTLRHRPV